MSILLGLYHILKALSPEERRDVNLLAPSTRHSDACPRLLGTVAEELLEPCDSYGLHFSFLRGVSELLATKPLTPHGEMGLQPRTELHFSLPTGISSELNLTAAEDSDEEDNDNEDVDQIGLQVLSHLVRAANAHQNTRASVGIDVGRQLVAHTEVKGANVTYGLARIGLDKSWNIALTSDLAKWPVSKVATSFRHSLFYLTGGWNFSLGEKRLSGVLGSFKTPYGKLYGSLDTTLGAKNVSVSGRVSLFASMMEITPYTEVVWSDVHEQRPTGEGRESNLQSLLPPPPPRSDEMAERRSRLGLGVRCAMQRPLAGRYTLIGFQVGMQQKQIHASPTGDVPLGPPPFRPVAGASVVHQIRDNILVKASLTLQALSVSLLWAPLQRVGATLTLTSTQEHPVPQVGIRVHVSD